MRTWDGFGVNPGESDLFRYARQGNVAGLRRLLELAPAEVNSQDARGNSPLILAAYAGFAEAAEYLLENGARVDLRNEAKETALMGAAFRGNLAIVMMLLRHGANPDLENAKGLSALGIATLFGRAEVAKLLSQRAASRVA